MSKQRLVLGAEYEIRDSKREGAFQMRVEMIAGGLVFGVTTTIAPAVGGGQLPAGTRIGAFRSRCTFDLVAGSAPAAARQETP